MENRTLVARKIWKKDWKGITMDMSRRLKIVGQESDLEAHAKFLWEKVVWGEKYHIGLIAGGKEK